MCTAVFYNKTPGYFGRNLDLEFSYDENVVITPRNYPFPFRKSDEMKTHYAMIGMAYVADGYPLYYDAANEKGLCMAGLNFPVNADYKECVTGRDNITPFEFIPWILGQCADISDARKLLASINLINENFSKELPLSPLHWMIADSNEAIVVESVADGLKVYDNPTGVMTNNPTFDKQLFNLNNYMQLSAEPPVNRFSEDLGFDQYSRGMGAIGLPGDLSSASRFVKATFTRMNSICGDNEEECVSQFFHILGSVEQQRGCVRLPGNKYEITIYSSCCNMKEGVYYYRTYDNSQISAVNMHHEDLDGTALIKYPLIEKQQIRYQN